MAGPNALLPGPDAPGGGPGGVDQRTAFAQLAGALQGLQDRAVAEAVAQAGALVRDHYALYHRVTPTGGGGWTLLYEHEVTGTSELSLTLPDTGSLDQTAGSLVLELRARSTATGTTRDTLTLQLNADAAYNYYYTITTNDNGTVSGFASSFDSNWPIGSCPKAGAAAGHFGMVVVDLPLYARTDHRKHYLAQAITGYGSGTGNVYAETARGWITGTTDAITALFLRPGTGEFATGSLARVWGVATGV